MKKLLWIICLFVACGEQTTATNNEPTDCRASDAACPIGFTCEESEMGQFLCTQDMPAGAEAMAGTEITAGAEIMAGAETMAGTEIMAGAETMAGTEIMAGAEIMGGTETMAGAEIMGGTETMGGAETMGGTETMAGTETMNGQSNNGISPNAPCLEFENACPDIEWVRLEGDTFSMGSNSGQSDELPVREVTIQSFEIMRTEVTVAMYRKCVDANVCSELNTALPECTWTSEADDKEDLPASCMSWFQISEFATWVGARLPSEAEWEFAARGGNRDVLYPWGNEAPDCDRVNFDSCYEGITSVCAVPAGNTAQGLCDMAGNVWEWVADEYRTDYIGAPVDGSPRCETVNCTAEMIDDPFRVMRGGYWFGQAGDLTVSYRNSGGQTNSFGYRGGRLARTITP